MNRTDVVAWAIWACANCLWRSQVKTSSFLVAAAMPTQPLPLHHRPQRWR